jgi:hypothetical protein
MITSTSTDFPVTKYGGTKSIVISTVSWIGGKNPFMGWAYVATACLFVVLGLAGTLRHLMSPRYAVPIDFHLLMLNGCNQKTWRHEPPVMEPTRSGRDRSIWTLNSSTACSQFKSLVSHFALG